MGISNAQTATGKESARGPEAGNGPEERKVEAEKGSDMEKGEKRLGALEEFRRQERRRKAELTASMCTGARTALRKSL